MTYYFRSPKARNPWGAGISASLSWEPAAGRLLSNSSTDETVTTNIAEVKVGGTLEVNVTILVGGLEVPSFRCTTAFHFTGKQDVYVTYATNSLTWTCVSAPVITWCT